MGTEMIVGAKNDPEWGPVVLAGFGGVTAEILKDVKLFTPDMDQAAVHAGLLELKQAALLKGYRGSPALDVAALAELIVRGRPDHGRQPAHPRDRPQPGDRPSRRRRRASRSTR